MTHRDLLMKHNLIDRRDMRLAATSSDLRNESYRDSPSCHVRSAISAISSRVGIPAPLRSLVLINSLGLLETISRRAALSTASNGLLDLQQRSRIRHDDSFVLLVSLTLLGLSTKLETNVAFPGYDVWFSRCGRVCCFDVGRTPSPDMFLQARPATDESFLPGDVMHDGKARHAFCSNMTLFELSVLGFINWEPSACRRI